MSDGSTVQAVTEEQRRQFANAGYLVVRGLLAQDEVEEIKGHFMELHARGPIPGCFNPLSAEQAGGDILKQYPRMMYPHRVDAAALRYLLHPQVMAVLGELFGEEAFGCQSMFYFKPPGARGQALHQDNFFLKIEPGTCIAAWMAIDPADEENGRLRVVPRTNSLELLCAQDTRRTDLYAYPKEVPVPAGMEAVPIVMDAGDVLFFGGNLIHGSNPNRSKTRFRRSFIGHYAGASAVRIGEGRDFIRYDGTFLECATNDDAGPCGGELHEP